MILLILFNLFYFIMKRVVNCEDEEQKLCIDDVDEGKFHTLETKSKRPFLLIRANATIDGDTDEDQYHWVALGAEKNRKTGFESFEDAIKAALKKDANTLKEHDTQKEAFLYLAELAGAYEDE